jgi:hypothetical protein
MKKGFPLLAADVSRVYEALRLPAPRSPGRLRARPVRRRARGTERRHPRGEGVGCIYWVTPCDLRVLPRSKDAGGTTTGH